MLPSLEGQDAGALIPVCSGIGEVDHGCGGRMAGGFELETSWLMLSNDGTVGIGCWGINGAGGLLDELAVVEIEGCGCWFFAGGDFGRRLSMSGVVSTRWGASGGGFRPPPPCQTFPSLSAKFSQYACKI